jgi:hypothetical protein
VQQLTRFFGELLPAAIVALPLAALAWWVLTRRRRRRMTASAARRGATLEVAIVLAALPVLYLVLIPVPNAGDDLVSLRPGAQILELIDPVTTSQTLLWQVIGNVLLLAPLTALVPLRVRRLRSLGRMTAAALLTSVSIEVVQWLMETGRVSAADDVILNTVGGTLGALFTRHWWRRRSRNTQTSSSASR